MCALGTKSMLCVCVGACVCKLFVARQKASYKLSNVYRMFMKTSDILDLKENLSKFQENVSSLSFLEACQKEEDRFKKA